MILVDSSVLIDFLAARLMPESLWLKTNGDTERIGITNFALCEVLQGLRTEKSAKKVFDRLSQFAMHEIGSAEIAIASARNFRSLRGLGITIRSTIDCLTATFCIKHGHQLLHRDRDFDAFEQHLGLKVLHPPETLLH